MTQLINNAVGFVKENIKKRIKEDSVVIDATLGNGHDTLFLCEQLGEKGFLYGFDIQVEAIEATRDRLTNNNCYNRVKLIHDGHENFDAYIKRPIDLIVYNLGYLPKGNKEITTENLKTLASVQSGMALLKRGGLILITVYPGHPSGALELKGLSNYLKTINQKAYAVMKIDFFNYKNNPPVVFMIERR